MSQLYSWDRVVWNLFLEKGWQYVRKGLTMQSQDEINFLTAAKMLAEKYDADIGFDLENNVINYDCSSETAEIIAIELVELFDKFEMREEEHLI